MNQTARKGRGPSPADRDARDGGALLASGNYEDALRAFDDALALDPKHPYSIYGAAYALTKLVDASPQDRRAQRIPGLVERLLQATPPNAYWEVVDDEEMPRKAIAFALASRAAHRLANSKGPKDISAARAAIEKALSMTHPTDDADARDRYAAIQEKVRQAATQKK